MGAAHLKGPDVPTVPHVKGCTNKMVYQTRAEAALTGRAAKCRPYRCPVCGKWHLTGSSLGKYRQTSIRLRREQETKQ